MLNFFLAKRIYFGDVWFHFTFYVGAARFYLEMLKNSEALIKNKIKNVIDIKKVWKEIRRIRRKRWMCLEESTQVSMIKTIASLGSKNI